MELAVRHPRAERAPFLTPVQVGHLAQTVTWQLVGRMVAEGQVVVLPLRLAQAA